MRTAAVVGLFTLLVNAGTAQTRPAKPLTLPSPLTEFAIIDAPYTCDVTIETTAIGEDGTKFRSLSPHTLEARDSHGRIRRESKMLNGTAEVTTVTIVDPAAGVQHILGSDGRVLRTARIPVAAAKRAPEVYQSRVAAGTIERTGSTISREALGPRTIEGIYTEGWRFTRTFQAGALGNDRPFSITEERWIAPDLAVLLLATHSDPRTGQRITRRSNIQRAEPDPGLFLPRARESVVDNTDSLRTVFGAEKK